MENNLYAVQHLTYLCLAMGTTAWVGNTLFKNGAAFLEEAFQGNARMASSVNRLLLVGFYLVNFGWVALSLESMSKPVDVANLISNVANQFGGVLLALGAMHFLNVYVLNRFRVRASRSHRGPPVSPEAYLATKEG